MKHGYIVPHTHWDREWRYPIWENRQYLIDVMEGSFDAFAGALGADNANFHSQYLSFLD